MNKLNVQKRSFLYMLIVFLISVSLSGCKDKSGKISVFDGLTDSPFLSQIKTAVEENKPIAISFTAEWCPHCRKYKPTFFEMKEEYGSKVEFINIDVEDSSGTDISSRFQVGGIPTTAFVRADGSVFKVQVGGIDKEDLTNIIEELLKSKKRAKGEPVAPFPIEPVKVEEPVSDGKPQDILNEEPSQEEKPASDGQPQDIVNEEPPQEEKPSSESEQPIGESPIEEPTKSNEPSGEGQIVPESISPDSSPEINEASPPEVPLDTGNPVE